MKKVIVNTLAAFATARRLFRAGSKTESQDALAIREEIKPEKQQQPELGISLARRRKRRESIAGRGRRRRQQMQSRPKRKYASLFVKFSLATLGVVGSVVGIGTAISSRLSIDPKSAVDPKDTFSTPFILTNNGWLPANDVEADCIYDKIIDVNQSIWINARESEIRVGEVKANHPVTVQCRLAQSDAPFSRADVRIVISYQPSFLPWRETETYTYTVVRGPNGTIHWLPR